MGMGGGGGGGEDGVVGSFPSGSEEKRLRPGVGNEATIAMDYLFKRLDCREMPPILIINKVLNFLIK